MRLDQVASTMELRSLSRLRGRVGVGVPPRVTLFVAREPPPAALFERSDLPRKRERCTEFAARPTLWINAKSVSCRWPLEKRPFFRDDSWAKATNQKVSE